MRFRETGATLGALTLQRVRRRSSNDPAQTQHRRPRGARRLHRRHSPRRHRGGASFSFSFGNGPAYGYGYGAPYGYYGGGYRYAAPRYYRNVRPSYAAPRYGYRYPSRYRACDRWMWDGWRQTYVLVRGRC